MLSLTEILTEQPATVTFVSETIDIAGVCLSMGAHRDHLFATLSDMIAWALRIRSHWRITGVGHSPVCQILLQIVVRAVIASSPPIWTSSTGLMSTTADFPFFNDWLLRGGEWSSFVSVWVQFSTDGSPLALWLYNSVQYSVHRFSICRSSVRHFPERCRTVVAFPYFIMVKSFTIWYAFLLLFFLRFSSISLHCFPIQFSLAFFILSNWVQLRTGHVSCTTVKLGTVKDRPCQ